MKRRTQAWAGGTVGVVTAAGLSGYFAVVGLDNADKLASVIGVFVALAGLGVAAYELVAGRRSTGPQMPPPDPAEGQREIAAGNSKSETQRAEDTPASLQLRAKASGNGRVYQAGHNQIINER